MKKEILLFVLLFIGWGTLGAQPDLLLQGKFQVGLPQEVFKDKIDATGFGGGGAVLGRFWALPFWAGVDVSWMQFDQESVNYIELIDGQEVLHEERTTNNLFSGMMLLRFEMPVRWSLPLLPYVEGQVGWNRFYTRTVYEDLEFDEIVDSKKEHADWAMAFGGSVGLEIFLERNRVFSLDLRATYLLGNTADFYARRISPPGNPAFAIDVFELKNSPTPLVLVQVGVNILLTGLPSEEGS